MFILGQPPTATAKAAAFIGGSRFGRTSAFQRKSACQVAPAVPGQLVQTCVKTVHHTVPDLFVSFCGLIGTYVFFFVELIF